MINIAIFEYSLNCLIITVKTFKLKEILITNLSIFMAVFTRGI